MVVQAQHESLAHYQKNRAAQVSRLDLSAMDTRSLLAPLPYHGTLLSECPPHQAVFMGAPTVDGVQRLSQQGLVIPNYALFQTPPPASLQDMDAMAQGSGSRKRRKESIDQSSVQHHPHKHQLQLGVDLNQTLGCSPASVATPQAGIPNVSTGLRLAFDDERSSVTSSRLDSNSMHSVPLKDELFAQLSQHQEELNQMIRLQAEQMRHSLEEKTQRQTKALLTAVEKGLSKRMREKEVEVERLSKRGIELEETIKQMSMENQMWQSKAKNNEAMVAILRANLQQAVLVQHQHQSREQQSRLEGCGESEVDDAASVYIDDNPQAQQCRAIAGASKASQLHHQSLSMMKGSHLSSNNNAVAMMRACKRCRAKEASVVLLPCLHLCLCITCKEECERCPVCSTLRSASVEVHLA